VQLLKSLSIQTPRELPTMKKTLIVTSVISALLVGAASARAAEAAELWTKNCAACHGKEGAGKAKLGTKDLSAAAKQDSFSDEKLFTELKDGMKDSDGKVRMKPFAAKLSDADLKALVAYVRTLKK